MAAKYFPWVVIKRPVVSFSFFLSFLLFLGIGVISRRSPRGVIQHPPPRYGPGLYIPPAIEIWRACAWAVFFLCHSLWFAFTFFRCDVAEVFSSMGAIKLCTVVQRLAST